MVPLIKVSYKYTMQRPLCPTCNARPVAINRHVDDRIYYRKLCDVCIRGGRKLKLVPAWAKAGYKKKPACEMCGFKFKLASQSNVFYIDGFLINHDWLNLKTICLNCQQELYSSKVSWKPSPIVPDF